MSIQTCDVLLYSFLSDGLSYIRSHPEVLDEIFAYYLEPEYATEFGEKSISDIKTWFAENNLPVVLAFQLTAQSIPCYSIHLAESTEFVETAYLSDEGGEIEEDTEPRVIINEFVPVSYDKVLGIIVVPDSVDLSAVYAGHIVKDAKNQLFQVLDITGQNITIDLGTILTVVPDMSQMSVQSQIDTKIFRRGEAYLRDSIDIGIHATLQANMVLWMYAILLYILFRFKLELISRGADLTTFSASDFRRDSMYLGDNIYSRWLRISARTRISWKSHKLDQADTLVTTVTTDDTNNS